MLKTEVENFISSCKKSGIDDYGFRHNGGSRAPAHGQDSCTMSLVGNNIITLERAVDHNRTAGPFVVSYIPVEDIMFMYATRLTTPQTITLLKELGAWNEETEGFVKHHGANSNSPRPNIAPNNINVKYGNDGGVELIKDTP